MSTQPLLDLLGFPTDTAAAQEKPTESRFGWATITGVGPLRIRKDGETDPLPMTPTVVGAVAVGVGVRVWCQYFGRRVLILGGGSGSDVGWAPITKIGGVGGVVTVRKAGPVVELVCDVVTATFSPTSSAYIINAGGIPAGMRPSITDARGNGYNGPGLFLLINARVDGSVTVTNMGTTTIGAVSGRVVWTVP